MTRDLHEEVLLLRNQMDDLIRSLAEREAFHFRPVEWGSLDRDQAREQWDRIAEFADWLVERYGIAETLPACWYRHPPLLEELSALHAAWLGAYVDPNAAADAGIAWHDSLGRVLQRVHEWDRTGCAGGTHRDDVPLPSTARQREERLRFIADDVDARHEPPSDDTAHADPPMRDYRSDDDPPTLRLI